MFLRFCANNEGREGPGLPSRFIGRKTWRQCKKRARSGHAFAASRIVLSLTLLFLLSTNTIQWEICCISGRCPCPLFSYIPGYEWLNRSFTNHQFYKPNKGNGQGRAWKFVLQNTRRRGGEVHKDVNLTGRYLCFWYPFPRFFMFGLSSQPRTIRLVFIRYQPRQESLGKT